MLHNEWNPWSIHHLDTEWIIYWMTVKFNNNYLIIMGNDKLMLPYDIQIIFQENRIMSSVSNYFTIRGCIVNFFCRDRFFACFLLLRKIKIGTLSDFRRKIHENLGIFFLFGSFFNTSDKYLLTFVFNMFLIMLLISKNLHIKNFILN